MKNIFKSIALIAMVTVVASCKDNAKTNTPESTDIHEQHQETVVEDTRFKVEISSNDQMQFNKKELKVPVGEPIVLTFKHTGKMAKNVMGHNFVLLKQGVDFKGFAEKASVATDTEYIPTSEKESVIAHTKVIGGGESDMIEFIVAEAGTYEFLCTFPGHYAIMRSVIIAE